VYNVYCVAGNEKDTRDIPYIACKYNIGSQEMLKGMVVPVSCDVLYRSKSSMWFSNLMWKINKKIKILGGSK